MKLSIMQPYFFPYIGYFQLIAATDSFVIYDNIKYTKKGWINRNRFLVNGKDATFSIPLVKDSDSLDVRDRQISPYYQREKLTRKIHAAYRGAPQFDKVFPKIAAIINHNSDNLFEYIHHSVDQLCRFLAIDTQLVISSHVPIDHGLRNQEKVIALCAKLGASEYINTIGGVELYTRDQFHSAGIDLKFIKKKSIEYPQFDNSFIPNLSIIDVLMFNPLDQVKQWVRLNYHLI
jgi:hypothetical protein